MGENSWGSWEPSLGVAQITHIVYRYTHTHTHIPLPHTHTHTHSRTHPHKLGMDVWLAGLYVQYSVGHLTRQCQSSVEKTGMEY